MAMTEIAISLEEPLLARINVRAGELNISPSRLVALAAEEYLEKHAPGERPSFGGESYEALLARINEAHADGLDDQERALVRGMRKKYRDTVKDPW